MVTIQIESPNQRPEHILHYSILISVNRSPLMRGKFPLAETLVKLQNAGVPPADIGRAVTELARTGRTAIETDQLTEDQVLENFTEGEGKKIYQVVCANSDPAEPHSFELEDAVFPKNPKELLSGIECPICHRFANYRQTEVRYLETRPQNT
jgi:hypothetical protein